MSEAEHESAPDEPTVTDVPEPDQDEHEPTDDAEDEAEAAEQETPPEPEASSLTQEQWEAIFTKSDRAFDAYVKKITAIWAEEALNLLPVVVSPSAPPGFLHKSDAGRVPDDVKTPILEFFGIVREQDYEDDPETRTCVACAGKGKTKTGSRVAGNETRACPECQGYGYVGPTSTNGAVVRGVEFGHAPAGEHVGPLVSEDRDNWGEPKILPDGRPNPNYGKQPQFKTLIDPWGITANLGAQDAVTP